MNIVLFTSSNPGDVNLLNIWNLVTAYPDFTYTYVVVDNKYKVKVNRFKNYIKEAINLLLFRPNYWYIDRRTLEKRISKQVPKGFDRYIKKHLVKEVNGMETVKLIIDLNPDIMIQCGAGILKENIFSIPRLGTLNVHHGIAPEVRGVSSTFWAMYFGLIEYIGVTVHFIDKTLDTGVVIIQKKTVLPNNFDYIEAVYQTAIQGAPLLAKAVKLILTKYQLAKSEVDSYYFSSVTNAKYTELKKNNFRPVKNFQDLPKKNKIKTLLINMPE